MNWTNEKLPDQPYGCEVDNSGLNLHDGSTSITVDRDRVKDFLEKNPHVQLISSNAVTCHKELISLVDSSDRDLVWELANSGRLLDLSFLDRAAARLDRSFAVRTPPGFLARSKSGDIKLSQMVKRFRELSQRIQTFRNDQHEIHPHLGNFIDVRGGIAAFVAQQHKLTISKDRFESLQESMEEVYKRASEALTGDMHGCFEWDEKVVSRNSKGWPRKVDGNLRRRLGEIAEGLIDCYGFSTHCPMTAKREVSLSPADWCIWTKLDKSIKAWRDLEAAAEALRWLASIQNGRHFSAAYEVYPLLRSINPDLTWLREQGHIGFMTVSTGQQLLVGSFPDLRLCCFEAQQRTMGVGGGEVAQALGHDNPRQVIAENWFRRRFPDGSEDSELHFRLIAEATDLAVDRLTLAVASEKLSGITKGDVDHKVVGAAERMISDLRFFRTDVTSVDVCRYFGIAVDSHGGSEDEPSTLSTVLQVVDDQLGTHVQNTIAGGNKNSWSELMKRATRRKESKPGRRLFEYIFTSTQRTTTGRLTSPGYPGERFRQAILMTEDDVLKEVGYELVRSGYKLMALLSGEFVVIVDNGSNAKQVQQIAESAAEDVTGVQTRCIIREADAW